MRETKNSLLEIKDMPPSSSALRIRQPSFIDIFCLELSTLDWDVKNKTWM